MNVQVRHTELDPESVGAIVEGQGVRISDVQVTDWKTARVPTIAAVGYEERTWTLFGRAVHGHKNAAEVLASIQGRGIPVKSYTELATSNDMTREDGRGALWLSCGSIEAAVEVVIVELRKRALEPEA